MGQGAPFGRRIVSAEINENGDAAPPQAAGGSALIRACRSNRGRH